MFLLCPERQLCCFRSTAGCSIMNRQAVDRQTQEALQLWCPKRHLMHPVGVEAAGSLFKAAFELATGQLFVGCLGSQERGRQREEVI